MEAPLLSLLTAAILTWLFTSLGLWIWAIRRVAMGGELLPREPREPFPGGPAEILIAVGVYIIVQAGLYPWIMPAAPGGGAAGAPVGSSRMVPLIVLNSAAMLSAVAAALAWAGSQGTSLRRMGMVPRPIDALTGILAAIMLLPPVFILQGVLSRLIEYHHPLLDLLQQPQPALTLVALSISSTLVAPLAEEFFFRGLLQGWFSRLAGVGRTVPQGEPRSLVSARLVEGDSADNYAGEEEQSGTLRPDLPYKPSLVEHSPPPSPRPWWPVFASSLVFALVHYGQGPAPITLFFLALGLGYLYRQTGRIWAGVVVHMALNGLTTVATILTTAAAAGAG